MIEHDGDKVYLGERGAVQPVAREAGVSYEPIERSRWLHNGAEIDRFFQRFVPEQYELGFCFRCAVIGTGTDPLISASERKQELQRIKPFSEHARNVQEIIAGNAEVLLELFEETQPIALDILREVGKRIVLFEPYQFNAAPDLERLVPSLRLDLGKRHHEKWIEQFQAALDAGKRTDPDHRGNRPFEDLPAIELEILRVQSWANIRVLGSLSDGEFEIVRQASNTFHFN